MFKSILATTAVLLIGFGSVTAKAQSSEEQILGAIAGGYLGSTIGQGDGRKAATIIGAIIGYRNGERILGSRDRSRFIELNDYDLNDYCRSEVPREYRHRYRLRDQWINGCMQRLRRQQRELEREAYEDGLYGSSN